MSLRHGGRILVDQLRIQGVERIFCIPGESFLAALDGLHDSDIETIVCRQEGGVAMMADATARLTGRPGIAFVTRGPGATNASAGVHIAFQDSVPMILFIGQVASDQKDREAFQEVDYRQMFGPLAKWVAEIESTDRIPEYVSHAFHVASSGRPGPVVLALPEDMLSASADVADAPAATVQGNGLSLQAVQQIHEALQKSEKPLIIAGGGGWSTKAATDIARLAEQTGVPVATSFRCQDYMDNSHDHYVGDVGISINPALADHIRASDCLLVIGARLGEMTTSGYTLLSIPKPAQSLVHIYPDADELGRVYRPDMGFVAGSAEALSALAGFKGEPVTRPRQVTMDLRASYEDWQIPEETPGDLKLEQVISHLRQALPEDAIITNGAGNYAGWLHRYYRFRRYRTQLAPTSGSMGFGLPASVAAKLQFPERTVICYAGDGDFQMHCQEFGTACQYGANIVVLISNNGLYGTIRMHQEKHYPGRVSGTGLTNPDFAKWAESYGGYGETVTRDVDFPAALERARQAGKPAILNLQIDPRALATRMVLKEV
uniref:thiamine pyrophosphate-binding protein n=1 Tax=Pararhizobium sp. IMCC3301 TaxID=3067904 RepID=UPI002741C622|nr:thiamine pyrophosphate-binding protein [Pararhizobium sp. IMCC3301]